MKLFPHEYVDTLDVKICRIRKLYKLDRLQARIYIVKSILEGVTIIFGKAIPRNSRLVRT